MKASALSVVTLLLTTSSHLLAQTQGAAASPDVTASPGPVRGDLAAPQPLPDIPSPAIDDSSRDHLTPTDGSGPLPTSLDEIVLRKMWTAAMENASKPQGADSGSGNDEAGRPWSAAQATGAPNTPSMGDISTAWAAARADAGHEWLSLHFTLEAELDRVRVVQSFHPGAIESVLVAGSDGQPVALPAVDLPAPPKEQGTEPNPPVVAEFAVPAQGGPALKVSSVLIVIDERKVPGWNEIDAVEIVSRNGARQWAQSATASSSYGDRLSYQYLTPYSPPGLLEAWPGALQTQSRIDLLEARMERARLPLALNSGTAVWKGRPWSPEQATGTPDTPVVGDYPTAWAPLTYDKKEWLDVTFGRPAELREVRIIESSATHAITGVKAYVDGALVPLTIRAEETLPARQGNYPLAQTSPESLAAAHPDTANRAPDAPRPHVIPASPANVSLPAVQKVRVEVDATGLNTWPEIDAVELVGTDGSRQWAAKAEASSTYARHTPAARILSRGYQRANTLEEANDRIENLTRRLEELERELEKR